MKSRLYAAAFWLLICGCAAGSPLPEEARQFEPTLATETSSERILRAIPRSKQKMQVSVYGFRDLTGQNKPAETPQYSKAVTQGGLELLKKALLDAGQQGWFQVLERGGLNDLLEERKIIRSVREQYAGNDGSQLPPLGPLLYSGLLLEGGIIAYDSNVLTGGLGARYLGIGGSTEYSRDMVTVSLRAVSVTTGEVLLAVTTSKTVLSESLQGGMFKYVSFDKLVETEAGYTVNEPPQLAVRQAIELAVYALIMEGAAKGLWEFQDGEAGAAVVNHYLNTYGRAPVSLSEISDKAASSEAEMDLENRAAKNEKVGGTVTDILPVREADNHADEITAKDPPRDALGHSAHNSIAPLTPARKYVFTDKDRILPGYYLQLATVASFGPNELDLVEMLRRHGYEVLVQRSQMEAVRFFRILAGPFNNRETAERAITQVAPLGSAYGQPFVREIH